MRRTLKSRSRPQTTKTTSTFAATTCGFVSVHADLAHERAAPRQERVDRRAAFVGARGDRDPVADGGMLVVVAQPAGELGAELAVLASRRTYSIRCSTATRAGARPSCSKGRNASANDSSQPRDSRCNVISSRKVGFREGR